VKNSNKSRNKIIKRLIIGAKRPLFCGGEYYMAGEGSIYKIKSGRHKGKWAAQISVGKDPESGTA
jgi:hypothetical protein